MEMPKLAVISGTIPVSIKGKINKVLTPYGEVPVYISERCIFLPRHGVDPTHYLMPHEINHPAHLMALKIIGVEMVIALNSTGSLKGEIRPGMLVVPDDFIFFGPNPTVFSHERRHITPHLDEKGREKLVQAARACGAQVKDEGVYWQTWGPRFETPAEIRFMSQWADIVGMTLASEAICASELGLPYAAICSVDNYANGITERPLSQEEVIAGAKRNSELMEKIVMRILA